MDFFEILGKKISSRLQHAILGKNGDWWINTKVHNVESHPSEIHCRSPALSMRRMGQAVSFAMHTAHHSRPGTGCHEARGLPSMFQASLPTTLFSAHRPVVIPCLSTLYYGRIIIYNGTICSLPSLSMGQIAFTGS